MNLLDESFQKKEGKNLKLIEKIILVLIILVVTVICVIFIGMVYMKNDTLKITLNNQSRDDLKSLLVFEKDENGDPIVYMPIRQIAKQLGYDSYNGEYGNKSEENNKCYIQSEQEIANFQLGSNKIYKLDLTKNNNNYEYVYSEKPVKAINGVLYAPQDAIEKAFNVSFDYNEEGKKVTIYTLSYLVEAWSPYVLDYGYSKMSDTFANQKAILKDMIVVEKENNIVGVIDNDGNSILEAKYDKIEYLPNVGTGEDFLVSSNGKVGVISKNRKTKISINYDSIELLDLDSELYIVKNDNKYGVMDFRGTKVISIENDDIGVDISKFKENNIKNKYILAENIIPVKKDSKWALYDKEGKQLSDGYVYDDIGYIASNNKNVINLLVIPEYNVLITKKDNRYIMVTKLGQELLPDAIIDDIYMTISGDEVRYSISANNITRDAIVVLEKIGVNKNTGNITTTQTEEKKEVVDEEDEELQVTTEDEENVENEEQENSNEEMENNEYENEQEENNEEEQVDEN